MGEPTTPSPVDRVARRRFARDIIASVRNDEEMPLPLQVVPVHGAGEHFRGVDAVADAELLAACTGAETVVAAWGNHGNDERLGFRANAVTIKLVDAGIKLHCLGTNSDGSPKHPHARGRHRVPDDQQPAVWA